MKTSNILGGFRALYFLDSTKYKNYVIDAIHHPAKLAGLVVQYGLQFIWILPFLFKRSDPLESPWYLSLDVIGSVIMALLLLIFLGGLNKASVSYAPGTYTMADANLLFPSPINQRSVYAWSMIRQFWSSLYTTVLAIIYLPLFGRMLNLPMNHIRLVYSGLTIMVLSILVSSLNFFVFSIAHRFNIGRLIKRFIKVLIIAVLVYVAWSMLSDDNVWEGLLTTLNGPLLGSIPIIGWAKTLIMAPFMGSISLLPLFSVLFASTLAIVGLSIYYAVDFYEESVTVAEWAQAVSKGDMSSLQSSSEKTQKKSKEIDLDWSLKGPWAFTWKQAIGNKRSQKFIILGWDQLLLLILGAIVGYFSVGFPSITVFALIYVVMYVMLVQVLPVGLQYELHKQYIYLLPGRPWQKISAVNTLLSLRAGMRAMALVLPIWLLSGLTFTEALSVFLFIMSADVLVLFGMSVVNVIFPTFDSRNVLTVYLRFAVFALSMAPAILIALLIGILTKSFLWGYFGFALGAVLTVFLQLLITDKIFWRMEMPS